MGKEKETAAAPVAAKVTVENVEEQINAAGIVTPEIAKAAAEAVAKRNNQQVTDALVRVLDLVNYTSESSILTLRKKRRDEAVVLTFVKAIAEIKEKLESGKIVAEDAEKAISEAKATCDKEIRASDITLQEFMEKVYNRYPNSSSYRWGRVLPAGVQKEVSKN